MTLGEIIREYTSEHSMAQFLKDSGLSKAYAYMLINNKNNSGAPIVPSIETIKKVAAGTHKSFNEVFALLDPNMDVSTRDDREDTSEVQFLGHHDNYYLDEDARELAEFLYNNPEYKTLFDASRKVKPEDLEFVRQMIERMGGTD